MCASNTVAINKLVFKTKNEFQDKQELITATEVIKQGAVANYFEMTAIATYFINI